MEEEEIKIKGGTLQIWEEWLKNELEPPIVVGPQQKYVLEAFLELIQKCKKII